MAMKLEEEIFNDEIERAQRMGGGVQPGYWNGYLTGLMRAFFGSEAVSDHLDSALLAAIKGEDTAAGYRDGYHKLADCRSQLVAVPGKRGFGRARGTDCHQSVRDDQRLAVCFMLSVYVQPDERRHGGIMNVLERPDGGSDDLGTTRIVGLGASAGGLEALEQFLANVPADSGLAYVVVQHLDPTHKAMLVELLQRATAMPVREATESMRVEPDVVYVIPPNSELSVVRGLLHLAQPSQPRGMRLPIDVLFCSLAREQGDRAIGVVLSGMGSDGTLGLQAIKAQGGLTLAQQPESAQFDSMPKSAIAAGSADIVAPPAELPLRILRVLAAQHATSQQAAVGDDSSRRAGPGLHPRAAPRAQQARSLALQDQHAEAPGRTAHGRPRPRHDGRVRGVPAQEPRGVRPAVQGDADRRDGLLP